MDFRPLKAVFEKLFMPPILEKRLNHDAIRTKVQIFKNHLARDILFLRRRVLYPTELQKPNWNGLPFFIGNHPIDIYYSIPKAVNPALFQNLCGPASRYFP